MSTDLSPYTLGGLLPSDTRRAGRALSRHHSANQLRIAKIDSDADVAIGKADADTAVTGSGMGKVVQVAQGQRALEQLAPEASGRLALLADTHALAMADYLADFRRDMRRR